MASDEIVSYDAVGWLAALVGAIGFGSFAVPIKGNAANSVGIDPLVMQSYKSLMCLWVLWNQISWFLSLSVWISGSSYLLNAANANASLSLISSLTSWLVVLLGQEISFTRWGIVSGLFWVPAGTFNIFAIRTVGMATSQAIVSSTVVMVSNRLVLFYWNWN